MYNGISWNRILGNKQIRNSEKSTKHETSNQISNFNQHSYLKHYSSRQDEEKTHIQQDNSGADHVIPTKQDEKDALQHHNTGIDVRRPFTMGKTSRTNKIDS